MSQNSRFRVDDLLDNDPTSGGKEEAQREQPLGEQYGSHGNVRNLCIVWEDGRRLFLNYAYLVSAEYRPSERTIALSFTTHEVVLKGIFLDSLYDALMGQFVRVVTCLDARYNGTAEKDQPRVNSVDAIKLI